MSTRGDSSPEASFARVDAMPEAVNRWKNSDFSHVAPPGLSKVENPTPLHWSADGEPGSNWRNVSRAPDIVGLGSFASIAIAACDPMLSGIMVI